MGKDVGDEGISKLSSLSRWKVVDILGNSVRRYNAPFTVRCLYLFAFI